jgi:hypothetical protein
MFIGPHVLAVVLLSAAIVWPLRRVRLVNAVSACGVPCVVAYCAYWLPVWLHPPDPRNEASLHHLDMYGAWAGVGIGLPLVPALLVTLIIVAVAERRKAKRLRGG